jgi:hypothetical protein
VCARLLVARPAAAASLRSRCRLLCAAAEHTLALSQA